MKAQKSFGNEVHILLIGTKGPGKSTLANAILGSNVFVESSGPTRGSIKCVESAQQQLGGITIQVYETCGLFDGETEEGDVIDAIQKLRPGFDYDVIVVCMKLHDRFDRRNREIFRIIDTMTCKYDIWSRTHVALTYCDESYMHDNMSQNELNEYNKEHIEEWKKKIKSFLEAELNVQKTLCIHSTTHIGVACEDKMLLRNWLPRFLLIILYKSRSLQTTLLVLLDNHLTRPAVEAAIDKVHVPPTPPPSSFVSKIFASTVTTQNIFTKIQAIVSRGDEGYEAIYTAL